MMLDISSIDADLKKLVFARKISPVKKLQSRLHSVIDSLKQENPIIRPYDEQGNPGGLLLLNPDVPVVVVPDLHARRDFLYGVISWIMEDGRTVLERLADHSIQLLCLGDGFHSEKRGYYRWVNSFEEFQGSYKRHRNMDQEMTESYGLMEMVMILKKEFPNNFHFLKGNHENIRNEEGWGNHPFGKFVYEGEMVRQWVLRFQGREFMDEYAQMEYLFPYMAIGKSFMASHAEPLEFYSSDEIINIDRDDDIKLGLTWTQNDHSEPGTVSRFLREYGIEFNRPLELYIGGHRTINGRYKLRAEGLYVQIHNPDKMRVFYSHPDREANPDRDIIDIEEEGALENESNTNQDW